MSRSFCTLFCFIFLLKSAAAQKPAYPQGYFRNPLGIPILLAGNFGECRPGHFHSGMDIKTGGHENEPVYAAADGYISRIKMEPGGFGHGLYITHPNGYTTLYAHLNDFAPSIQRYVRQQQYAQESWTADLQLSPQQFPVRKGEQIAWSGNTGGSTAPHLHFEIRDTKTEHPLNGQLFGFEVKDTRAPVPTHFALYKGGDYPPELIRLTKRANVYTPDADSFTMESELVGIGIVANDFMEGSDNTLAFYTAEWYVDDSIQGRICLDDIGYDESRYVNAYADYGTKQRGGPWIHQLFRLPGNRLDRIYELLNRNQGICSFADTFYHRVKILLEDVYGNSSEIKFTLRTGSSATILYECLSRYFEAGKLKRINEKNVSFYLDETALYKGACIAMFTRADSTALSPRFKIGTPDIPVHHYFELSLKPDKLIPFALRGKLAIINDNGKSEAGKAAAPAQQGFYKASFRDFGEFRIVADTIAPLLRPAAEIRTMIKAGGIAFRVTDNFTSVKSFRGELDGKWILFEQHEATWTYFLDTHCGKGAHRLVIKATDENGNEATASYTFTR